MTDTKTWIQEAQRTPSSINAKTKPNRAEEKNWNIIFRLKKQTMDEILKEARGGRERS